MENENEVLEVEIELGDGSKQSLYIQEVDEFDYEEIPKGSKALMTLVDNQVFLCEIQSADDEGVSFKIEGGRHTLHHESDHIKSLHIQVTENN